MSLFQEIKFRIKNTFVELEEEDEVQPPIARSRTDSEVLRRLRAGSADAATAEDPAQPHSSFHGFAAATAAVAASAARAAAETMTATAAAVPQQLNVSALIAGHANADSRKTGGKLACRATRTPQANEESKGSSNDIRKTSRRSSSGDADASSADVGSDSTLTTVMLRNLPNDYTRDMLLNLLDAQGFAGRYDFLYLPIDFSRKAGLGYAFVNMLAAHDAQRVRKRLEGFRRWSLPSTKVCSVGWSNPCQGLEANIERYRDSPVMHASVPDEFKPVLLVDGKRVQFPQPTKKLRKPEMGKAGRQLAK